MTIHNAKWVFLQSNELNALFNISNLVTQMVKTLRNTLYLLQTLNLLKYVNGSSIPHIYFKDYCIEKVNVPTLVEQEKIGNLFVNTDKTLDNINKNIKFTQEFKKGLLQQMFI